MTPPARGSGAAARLTTARLTTARLTTARLTTVRTDRDDFGGDRFDDSEGGR
ncbi:hypothetical protein [Streptomyces sp. LN325]|uniref:hypothetical protein n=1 Tax=Streptomyces sp. LN325 TaxID=3112976 RepID=UPI003713168B